MEYGMTQRMFRIILVTLAAGLALLTIPPAYAADNDGLASDFGGFGVGGIVVDTPLVIADIAIQPDGKIIAVGATDPVYRAFAVARFLPNGALDPSFGANGMVVTPIIELEDRAWATGVALQMDGKIVVSGTVDGPDNTDFAVVRYMPNGALDAGFSNDGVAVADFDRNDDEAAAVAVSGEGIVIVAGRAKVGGDFDFAALALTPDGSFYSGFSGDGKVAIGFDSIDYGEDVLILPDGRILLFGDILDDDFGTFNEWIFAFARLNANGSLDTSFDRDGKLTTDIGSTAHAGRFIRQSDGKIVAVGTDYDPNAMLVARYNPDGALDPTLDNDGKLSANFGGAVDGNAVAVLPDGRIIAAGMGENVAAIAQYQATGRLDPSFDGDGRLLVDLPSLERETIVALERLSDGRLIAAGERYLMQLFADGTFDSGGRQIGAPPPYIGDSNRVANATLVQPDGKIVSAGYVYVGGFDYDFVLTRHTADGQLDPSFGFDGNWAGGVGGAHDAANDAVLQPDGKIIIVGHHIPSERDDSDVLLARFNPNGQIDGSCAGGWAIVNVHDSAEATAVSIALQRDGKILVAGAWSIAGTGIFRPFIARFTPSCALDTTFNDDGIALLDYGSSVADILPLADGRVMLVGSAPGQAFLARYTADGRVDRSFDGDGRVTTDLGMNAGARAAAIQPDGKIVVAGRVFNQGQYDFALLRYQPDGSLDRDFGANGMVISQFGDNEYPEGITLLDGGRIAVAGCGLGRGIGIIALYTANGALDSSLTGDGWATLRAGGATCLRDVASAAGRLAAGGYASNGPNLSFALAAIPIGAAGAQREVHFAARTATVMEQGGNAVLTVNLNQVSSELVTVQYAVTGGSATGGSDYTLAAGTLTFAPGQSRQQLSVSIINDGVAEANETVVIGLNDPQNAVLGDAAALTLTIVDDDGGSDGYLVFMPLMRRGL
jgi:uncharacterized delta-60 repeat protein